MEIYYEIFMERHNKIFVVRQSVKSGIESCLFFLVVEVCVWGGGGEGLA